MSLKGNKGEWSEVYVLFKLLADGKLYGADSNLEKIDNVFYEIIKIIRNEKIGTLNFVIDNDMVNVINTNENTLLTTLDSSEYKEQAEILLNKISNSKTSSFDSIYTERFMKKIYCEKLKAPSLNKSDITIKIYDVKAKYNPELGFSIKSQLGSPSTLINAGKTTNFIFKISGELTNIEIDTFNNSKDLRKNLNTVLNNDHCFQYVGMDNDTFNNNLILLDSDLPNIVGEMLIEYYTNNKVKVIDALKELENRNPLNYKLTQQHPFYKYKFKKLITSSALGMLPAKVWDGITDATGGYIIVRQDGEVLCYHLYNRNEFEEYLINNTRFDTPSSSRHSFGTIFRECGELYIKLNLQIRFVK